MDNELSKARHNSYLTSYEVQLQEVQNKHMLNEWQNKWIFFYVTPISGWEVFLSVKNPHLVSTHEVSLRTQWVKLVQQALDEWVAEDSWPGSEGWLEKHASQCSERHPS